MLSPLTIHTSCLAKQAHIRGLFATCTTQEQVYAKIIELGRALPPFLEAHKTPTALVQGCQSQMYLYSEMKEELLYFQVHSEALISAGLGALLITAYSGESPETILSCPPLFLQDLQLHKNLSPGRSNGLASLLDRMKREALLRLTKKAF